VEACVRISWPEKVAISAVTRNAGGVDAVHLPLHLLDAPAIGRGLELCGLLVQRAGFGEKPGAIGAAHRNVARDGRQMIGRLRKAHWPGLRSRQIAVVGWPPPALRAPAAGRPASLGSACSTPPSTSRRCWSWIQWLLIGWLAGARAAGGESGYQFDELHDTAAVAAETAMAIATSRRALLPMFRCQ